VDSISNRQPLKKWFLLGLLLTGITLFENLTFMQSQESETEPQSSREAEPRGGSPLVISAADFRSDGTKPDSYWFSFGGGYMEGNSQTYGCVMAPAYLPHGATINSMWVSVKDNSTTYDASFNLWRVSSGSGSTDTLATASTAGNDPAMQFPSDTTINFPDVNYPLYAYYVTTCLQDANIDLYSVRIYFTEP
jgi:hypothetical protein